MKANLSLHPLPDVHASARPPGAAVVASPGCAPSGPSDRDEHASTLPPRLTSNRAGALQWLGFGLDVIPIRPGTKLPAVKWDPWLQRLSVRQIVEHWTANPTHEVGFIVGEGLVVFDADSPKAAAALVEAECRFGVLPSMIVQTTRGEHHYFQKSPELPCKTTCKTVGDGPNDRIDIKTGRTMVVLPPSTGKVLAKFGDPLLERADQMNAAPFRLLRHFGALVVPNDAGHCGPVVAEAPSAQTMRLLVAGLNHLSADCDYDTWLRIGAIAFHVSGGTQEGLDCFDAWSATGVKYKGLCEVRAKWKTFRLDHPRPLTMATLRFMLTEQGEDWMDICAEADGDVFQVIAEEAQ